MQNAKCNKKGQNQKRRHQNKGCSNTSITLNPESTSQYALTTLHNLPIDRIAQETFMLRITANRGKGHSRRRWMEKVTLKNTFLYIKQTVDFDCCSY